MGTRAVGTLATTGGLFFVVSDRRMPTTTVEPDADAAPKSRAYDSRSDSRVATSLGIPPDGVDHGRP